VGKPEIEAIHRGQKWTGHGLPGPKASAVYADRDDVKDNILSHVG